MLVCDKCGNDNPIGTMYCRRCGQRISVNAFQLQTAIGTVRRDEGDVKTLRSGHSALGFAIFLLLCAIALRVALVPALPVGSLLPPDMPALLPESAPQAAPPAAVDQTLPAQPARILWRRGSGRAILDALGVDGVAVATAQKTILALQAADGSFPGNDVLAATSLAALALQAWPQDDQTALGAQRARTWILSQARDLAQRPALARSLAAAALADGGELDPMLRSTLGVFLVDGKVPFWQLAILLNIPPQSRPRELAGLRQALPPGPCRWLFALTTGGDPAEEGFELKALFSESARSLATGEARLAWVKAAWQIGLAPRDLADTLRLWSPVKPVPCDPALQAACGDWAASALAIMTACAPISLPALAISAPR